MYVHTYVHTYTQTYTQRHICSQTNFVYVWEWTHVACFNKTIKLVHLCTCIVIIGQPGTCNMKIMRKHVVTKLLPYCKVVCYQLGYSVTSSGQDKKDLIAVLEAWIEKEGRPKTWQMFIEVLSINELSTVTSQICIDLKKEGIYISKL